MNCSIIGIDSAVWVYCIHMNQMHHYREGQSMADATQGQPTPKRYFTAEGYAESLDKHMKKATVKGREFLCDESIAFGGQNSAPGSMDYFIVAILF